MCGKQAGRAASTPCGGRSPAKPIQGNASETITRTDAATVVINAKGIGSARRGVLPVTPTTGLSSTRGATYPLSLNSGDRLALIGANGVGKTMLLRVMAGIYEPVARTVSVRGRIRASMGSHQLSSQHAPIRGIISRATYLSQ